MANNKTTKLRVDAFSLLMDKDSLPLQSFFEQLASQELIDRSKVVRSGFHRIDSLVEKETGVWHVETTKMRTGHIPGKGSRDKPVTSLQLKDDESLFESTAVLFDLNNNLVIIQYNFVGPRIGSVIELLNVLDKNKVYGCSVCAKYSDEELKQFEKREATKKFTFKIDQRDFTAEDKKQNKGLYNSLALVEEIGGQTVEVTISAGRTKGALNKAADKLLDFLMFKSADQEDSIKKLQCSYVSEYDNKLQQIDLLAERLTKTFETVLLRKDNRIELGSRFEHLELARELWKK